MIHRFAKERRKQCRVKSAWDAFSIQSGAAQCTVRLSSFSSTSGRAALFHCYTAPQMSSLVARFGGMNESTLPDPERRSHNENNPREGVRWRELRGLSQIKQAVKITTVVCCFGLGIKIRNYVFKC